MNTTSRSLSQDGLASLLGILLGIALACKPSPTPPAVLSPEVAAQGSSSAVQLDQALWHAARDSKANYVRDLATLVNIDTCADCPKGLAQLGEVLAQRLEELGAVVELLPAAPAAGKMVHGTFRGTGSARILLLIHFDTVFGEGEVARRPFKVEGSKAFGPGVADAKGGVAIILHALAIARRRGFQAYETLSVLFNPDEEKSSLGSREMIRTLSADQDYVLSYEPPNAERVIVATNGIAYVQLAVLGRASHASEPEKGRNAAIELAAQILQLNDLGDAAKGTTVSWTVIQSGGPANVIPERATATADMRMSDSSEIARVQNDANQLIRKRLVPDTEVTLTVEQRRPPLSRNPHSERLGALAQRVYQELGRSIEPVGMRYGTDAGFAHHAGRAKPAVLEGLGIVGDRLHSPDEWADLDSVVPRLYLTVRMLEELSRRQSSIPLEHPFP
jgi:glutamate carboxypeptidase